MLPAAMARARDLKRGVVSGLMAVVCWDEEVIMSWA